MPVRQLPSKPSLDHFKYQAKDLLKDFASRSLEAAQRIREFHPRFSGAGDGEIFAAEFSLSNAQLVIAREYGFANWMRLKKHTERPTQANSSKLPHHERIEDPVFRRAVDLLDAGDVPGLRAHLYEHPKLVQERVVFEGENYFRNPTLLEFIAENPIRRGTLPNNIVEVAKVLLEAGAEPTAVNETLGLVCSGCIARECHVQLPLIDLLCDYGADPASALQTAAVHGEFEALNALVGRGARITLGVAAALGDFEKALRLLPDSDPEERHRALALASQFGHAAIVQALLDAGEDPDRYNPVGFHSHATPMHQAALAGHEGIVRLLVERGARVDLRDLLWQGTPAGWAEHEGHTGLSSWLRAQEERTATLTKSPGTGGAASRS